jgi:hypothetical protein
MSARYLWELTQNPPSSSNQAAVTTSITTTATTTNIETTVASLIVLVNQIRSDLVTAGVIKGSA